MSSIENPEYSGKVVRTETVRKQVLHGQSKDPLLVTDADDFEVWSELGNHLPTGSAWSRRFRSRCEDQQGQKITAAGCNRLTDGIAFGTDRQSE